MYMPTTNIVNIAQCVHIYTSRKIKCVNIYASMGIYYMCLCYTLIYVTANI